MTTPHTVLWSNKAPIFRPNLRKFHSTKWGTPGHIETDPLQEAQEAKGKDQKDKSERIDDTGLDKMVTSDWSFLKIIANLHEKFIKWLKGGNKD